MIQPKRWLAVLVAVCSSLAFSQETQEGRLMRFPDIYKDKVVFSYGGDLWLASTSGGVAQRWMLVYSEHRHAQAQRTVDKQLLKQGQREVVAFQKLGRMTFACEADAQQALATFTQG